MHEDRRPWFVWPKQLRRHGVLGINGRNAGYILPSNPRRHYPRVDDKVLTKGICQKAEIVVPDTYAVIERQGDIGHFVELLGDHREFVIKPARGAGGRGIMVVVDHDGETFTSPSGTKRDLAAVKYHLSTVLSGLYSLGGQHDKAIVEQRIVCHDAFSPVCVDGTPDIRVILFRSIPVMAMARLPTRASRGRANLHQGAIAAGIELETGRAIGGVSRNRAISVHPDTGNSIRGFEVPFWDRILDGSMRLADALELGYVGVDYVVDAQLGPVVLEANARPGLAIQVANRTGLLNRLRYLEERIIPTTLAERREMIKQLVQIV